ncbi:DNA-directed RNA polymerase subunit beta [Lacticaseibacillus rhamnosus 2166]|nr:DNA-directed RNA polymerase subunit beta [Lacticaseibacillus rhamnosus 2166]
MDSQYPKRVFHHVKIWLIVALIALILGLLIGFGMGGDNPFKVFFAFNLDPFL